jgi:hypothetical protein
MCWIQKIPKTKGNGAAERDGYCNEDDGSITNQKPGSCATVWLNNALATPPRATYHLLVVIAQPNLCRATLGFFFSNNNMADKHADVYPADFIKSGNELTHLGKGQGKPALIILNQPIADTKILDRLWSHTSYRLCADGGANQLHDLFVQNNPSQLDQYVRRLAAFASAI